MNQILHRSPLPLLLGSVSLNQIEIRWKFHGNLIKTYKGLPFPYFWLLLSFAPPPSPDPWLLITPSLQSPLTGL